MGVHGDLGADRLVSERIVVNVTAMCVGLIPGPLLRPHPCLALDTAEAADDDESKDSALELVQDQLEEFNSTVACSKNAHARGRHMTDLQWHVHTGHVWEIERVRCSLTTQLDQT